MSLGVETLTRQCVVFVWTFRDRINLGMVWNESFHDESDTKAFVEKVREVLLRELGVEN